MVALIFMSVSFLFPFLSLWLKTIQFPSFLNSGQWDDFVEYRADLTGGVFGWRIQVGQHGWRERGMMSCGNTRTLMGTDSSASVSFMENHICRR